MSRSIPTRSLRPQPDLDQLKRQAKELLSAFRKGEPDASAEVQAHYREAHAPTFALHDAQLVIARAHGFDSWPRLKAFVDGVTVTRLGEAVRAGDLATVRAMLTARPELVHMDMSEHNEHRALHYAVLNRDATMVRLLMERGADPYKGIWPHRDATGALTLASDRGYDEIAAIVNEMQQRGRREQAVPQTAATGPDVDRSSPLVARLWEAITANDEATAIACFTEDPRLIQWHQGDGWTPLHQASLMLYLDLARWLIAHGADVNAYEPCYWTPLELVGVYRKHYTPEKSAAMVALLTSHGARMTGLAARDVDRRGRFRARDDPARRRRAPGWPRRPAPEHSARLGVPMGATRAGRLVPEPRRRSARARCGTVGGPARLGDAHGSSGHRHPPRRRLPYVAPGLSRPASTPIVLTAG
jgi:ankyrin repeat protein